MKNIFPILLGLLSAITSFSQSCLPEGIIFTTQVQIDSFQVNYPNCIEIEGDVLIYDSWNGNITNLNGLSELRSIGGELLISENPSLTSLEGMESLTYIGDNLKILNNNALINLSGLESIQFVGNYINITWNFGLIDLTGLEGLTAIGGGLHIGNNYVLNNLTGLENISSIGHDFTIFDNDALVSLSGISNLRSIGADLRIVDNDALTSLNGLDSLNHNTIVDLIITMNDLLSTCNVESICYYLASPNGQIDISGNATGCDNQIEILNECLNGFNDKTLYANDIHIYPNPFTTQITVETLPIDNQIHLYIYNMTGQRLYSHQIQDQTTVINICEYKQGIYCLILNDGYSSKLFKIVKK